MALFDSELLQRCRRLALLARHRGGRSLLAGSSKKLPAGGTELTGLRDYAPGDDHRQIDWTWCARRDELLTKMFEGHVDQHVYVLLDCSPSMALGRPAKSDLARQIAAALGYVVLEGLDCLGVAAFSAGLLGQLSPLRGKARVPLLFRFLRELPLQGTATDLARTAESFLRTHPRPGPVVILSDLYDRSGFQRGLGLLLERGYQLRVVQIYDPGEADPGRLGEVELFDVESQAAQRVTVTERTAARYRQLLADFHESVRRYCAKHGIRCLQLPCDAPEEEVLLRVLTTGH